VSALSLYPDGLTGREPEIAGYPERETTIESQCDECDFEGEVEATEYMICAGREEDEVQYTWTCPKCGEENTDERTILTVDPDAVWDATW
jgi:hypothetical protein